jgi:ABC-type Fe3+-hydroxamate transport system substrate-binding protein
MQVHFSRTVFGFIGERRSSARVLLALLVCVATPGWASRVLKDETGRTVTLPDKVQRVISLTPSITNTIYSLGGASQVAAVTDYTQYPAEARKKPSVGDILHPSLERIASLRPDVVIALSTLNSPDTIRNLERIGIPVFLVSGQDLAGVYRAIDSIGRVLGREKEALALSADLHAREERVRTESTKTRHPRVLLLLSINPCITAGHAAFISQMISAAGAVSVTDHIKQDWIRVSVESLLPTKPDYLIALMDAPFDLKQLQSQPGWSQLDAVRLGRILRVDDRLQVPGPVAFDGLEEFARQLRAAEEHR